MRIAIYSLNVIGILQEDGIKDATAPRTKTARTLYLLFSIMQTPPHRHHYRGSDHEPQNLESIQGSQTPHSRL